MTPQQLRNSILQLAIQGKLVEQRSEEGTAEELYQKIQAEKKRLIKEGKIKKEKALPEMEEKEIPFELPESWKWVRWGEIVNIVSARRVHQADWKKEGVPFFRAREIAKLASDGYVDNELFISQELFDEFSKTGIPQPGDLMVTAVGTLGKVYIVKSNDRFYYKDASVICFENFAHLCSKFLKFIMQSEMMNKQIKSNSSGTTVATLTMVRMAKYLMPLPPLAEQKRIVAKLEELMPLVDRYEEAWTKLEVFNVRFPMNMQKSLLKMAMEGKLVEQRPEEGTGEELYQQVQEEKKRLIKEGKSKKDKKLFLDIEEKEIPFDIPENWKWTNLGRLLRKLTDGTHKTPKYTTSGVKFVSVKDMSNGVLSLKNTKFISEEEHQELYSRCDPEYGDMLLSKVGTTGVPAIVDTHEPFSLFVSVALLKYNHDFIDEKFFYYLLKSPLVQSQASEKTRGMANKNWVLDKIANTLVVLPPLAEQKRIVAKLEELLPLCERLKS